MSALNEWATDPDASHVAVTPDAADLEAIFAELAANISKTGATDIVINEVLNPDFTITSLDDPTRGSASTLDSHTIRWTIPALGVTGSEAPCWNFSFGTRARSLAKSWSMNPSNTPTPRATWWFSPSRR